MNARRKSKKKRSGKYVWKKFETLVQELLVIYLILRVHTVHTILLTSNLSCTSRHGEAIAKDLAASKKRLDPSGSGRWWCLHPDMPEREDGPCKQMLQHVVQVMHW